MLHCRQRLGASHRVETCLDELLLFGFACDAHLLPSSPVDGECAKAVLAAPLGQEVERLIGCSVMPEPGYPPQRGSRRKQDEEIQFLLPRESVEDPATQRLRVTHPLK